MDDDLLTKTLDAILITAEKPLSIDQLLRYFPAEESIKRENIREALEQLHVLNENRGFELKQVSSGYRYQSKADYQQWVGRHFEDKPKKYSRALLETLALIIYRQPVTRAEIEEVRGVTVSSNITKTLLEREWIRVVGHKEVPGRPAMFGTTKQLLDYFNLESLDDMPGLAELTDIDSVVQALNLPEKDDTSEGSDGDSQDKKS